MASSSMQIHWNKRKCLHMKRLQLSQGWLGTPIWPPWRRVKTLCYVKIEFYNNYCFFFNYINANEMPGSFCAKHDIFASEDIAVALNLIKLRLSLKKKSLLFQWWNTKLWAYSCWNIIQQSMRNFVSSKKQTRTWNKHSSSNQLAHNI